MAGGKETPRQKMIGMMYLVLTALLALNVSKEIINAFVKLDAKLMESNKVFIAKSESIMSEFEKSRATEMVNKVSEAQSKVLPWKKVAEEIRIISYSMDKFINVECKNKLLADVEGEEYVVANDQEKKFVTRNLMDVQLKDDYDAPTRLFGGEAGTEGYNFGAQIREKIHRFRDEITVKASAYFYNGKNYKFNPANVKDAASLEKELSTNVFADDQEKIRSIYNSLTLPEKLIDQEEEVAWQLGMFDHAPVVAAAALFTSLSNDIRLAESQALEIVLSRVKVPPFTFNKIEPLAFAPTGYLNLGDSMNIRIMIAAYDSNQVSKIQYALNDSTLSAALNSTGKVPVRANAPGEYTMFGKIAIKENGVEKWKPWSYSYEVGEPVGVVSNEDLTIIYAGYNHTFSASASGFPQDKISLLVPGAEVKSIGNGKFSVLAKPNLIGQKIKSSIIARSENGSKSLSGPTFVVKKLPKPTAYFGSLSSDNSKVTPSQLRAQLAVGMRAGYNADVPLNPTKVKFNVSKFSCTILVGANQVNGNSNSNQVPQNISDAMKALRPGMKVIFNNINATGPGGVMVTEALVFEII